ncbi:hypothetical protein M441DRAFT_50520 [Trichoderma asperellum CBS 433.97]|uniref:Uncharacterized protein n=1 Tax=Trichoderma asperellum (strain ATCC 204424 / CBS 433.97 / NBRC 101777) TaxID=1042311 RepID=A0A2T3YXE1_TRIA4|nr:hypothetical protein M441DRAFT_50520 [Trichoderma asperellum CBS 433.97]PTB37241.1 hypothetical protein M441DRAFT_50520 [Trichoderma asperellum CBS 433.97]
MDGIMGKGLAWFGLSPLAYAARAGVFSCYQYFGVNDFESSTVLAVRLWPKAMQLESYPSGWSSSGRRQEEGSMNPQKIWATVRKTTVSDTVASQHRSSSIQSLPSHARDTLLQPDSSGQQAGTGDATTLDVA